MPSEAIMRARQRPAGAGRDTAARKGEARRGGSARGARMAREASERRASGEPELHAQIAEIQRSRLLAAAIGALDEQGYERATVSHITHRARVSRRTFYELFANREECIAAVLDDTAARVRSDLEAAGLTGLAWRERMRGGLWTILCFLDREPALARVAAVEALRGGGVVLARREAIVAALTAAVDEARLENERAAGCTALTAEGVVGAVLAILHTRLSRERREPLTSLLGELLAMIVLPYQGAVTARREQSRCAPALLGAARLAPLPAPSTVAADPLAGLRMRLTYRTARVLEGVGEHPGASNREVADHANIHDQGQVSKLLARLQRLGLLTNHGDGHAKGAPNAWTLTPTGVAVAHAIAAHLHTTHDRQAA